MQPYVLLEAVAGRLRLFWGGYFQRRLALGADGQLGRADLEKR